ncbi:MAG TPA: SRPBCC domain-containing protein [Thermoplasmata archaeon]|nr:SRPBCC domain-containing protein [Thermoplasmata archaeon]
MPESGAPAPGTPGAPRKPPPPRAAVLGDAKITINAPVFRVFAALTSPEQLAAWWGQDAIVEPDVGGRYETTLSVGRVEGTIMAIDGPGTLAFAWTIPSEGASVTTSVHYELSPRGPQTAVHVAHRGLKEIPGDWSALWQSVLESLKAYVEGASTA